jgi:N-sulfoglucosamine sulfohydrolase
VKNGDRPRPNILFAIADDASHMSAYGHTFLNTPHFDRVAAEGVLFTHAYTTNPKCAPSRASILTGRHTWQLEEASCHFGKFPSKFAVYPSLLEEAGYHVGHTGKGWGPGDYEAGGFEHNPAGRAYHGAKLDPPTTGMSAKDYAGNFARFLDERPDDAPFCFWYGAHEPHRHYEEGSGVRAGRRTEDVTPPAYLPDEEIVRSDLLDYTLEVEWFDEHLGRILAQLEEAGELADTLVVVTSDNGMPFPRVKGQMYEHDFNMPFAAMWRGAVKGGRVVTDFVSFRDIGPTFLEAAGLAPHEDMTGASFLNVLTSNEAGRVDPSREHVLMGRERHDLGREGDLGYPVRVIRTDEWLYARNYEPERWPAGNPETGYTNMDSSPTRSLIIEQHDAGEDTYWALAVGKRPAEEMYRVEEDPECMRNLAADPACAAVKDGLRERMEAELTAQGDPRLNGNAAVFDTYEYVGASGHSWKNYVAGTWKRPGY